MRGKQLGGPVKSMQRDEGKELIEYALIAIVASLGVALILSGMGPTLITIWRAVAAMVVG